MPTYPVDLPTTPKFKSLRYTQNAINAASRSPFSGAQQIYTWGPGWWQVEALLPPMRRGNAVFWAAALHSLNGMQGTFNLIDPMPRLGTGSGSGVVWNASPPGYYAGTYLLTSGWAANAPLPLYLGDWINIANVPGLYKVTAVSGPTTDAMGHLGIEVWPALRAPAYHNWAITYTNAVGVFRLADNTFAYQFDEGQLMMGLSIKGIEAF